MIALKFLRNSISRPGLSLNAPGLYLYSLFNNLTDILEISYFLLKPSIFFDSTTQMTLLFDYRGIMDSGPNSGTPPHDWAIAKWNWTEVCGEKGFYIWDANKKDLGLCFSIIGIQLPLLTIFSVVSAYYFGKPTSRIVRTSSQLCTIWLRCIIVLLMALLPIVQICLLTSIQSKKLEGSINPHAIKLF